MSRKEGSGLHRETASTIERLAAAVFVESDEVRAIQRHLDDEVEAGYCGVASSDLVEWLDEIAAHLGLPAVEAVTPAPDQLGDIRLTLSNGEYVWIEVKAQTTKGFRDLMQADWVRDETDALRWLLQHDRGYAALAAPWVRETLEVGNPVRHFGDWTFGDLWLADIALLPDRPRRAVASVVDRETLGSFMSQKYILHITYEGARIARLDSLRCVQDVLAGGRVYIEVAAGGSSNSIVWVSTSGRPVRGQIDFAYYTGYENSWVVGRHKLNDRALSRSDALFTVWAS